MVTPVEMAAMRRAIALSAFGLGTTSPNPPVGCVILDSDGKVAGEGFHERKGEAHAEAHALAAAGDRARGGTAVVTLEPCNHHGRTPPCRQALLDAGIERCLIAVIDPTSREEGGAARLRAAGVDVEVGVLAEEARLVLGPWLHAQTNLRPFVTWAHRIDERGRSVPLPAALELEHRQSVDAVVAADGSISEGVPGGHGRQTLHLPPSIMDAKPTGVMDAVYAGGARSVLFNVERSKVELFIAAEMVDRIETYLPRPEVARPHIVATESTPVGYRLVAVEKLKADVRVSSELER